MIGRRTLYVCSVVQCWVYIALFFFNDTATTEIYTLSLHDALPIFHVRVCIYIYIYCSLHITHYDNLYITTVYVYVRLDRKSTRLNSSHW